MASEKVDKKDNVSLCFYGSRYNPLAWDEWNSCLTASNKKVGEVPRRTVGKTIAVFFKEEIKEVAAPLQVCPGHNAGSEDAIHVMSQVFIEEGKDGILLIDATNAFNQRNRSVALYHIQITCKEMSFYIIKNLQKPFKAFYLWRRSVMVISSNFNMNEN